VKKIRYIREEIIGGFVGEEVVKKKREKKRK
jgi:hypothetical protein